MQLKNREEKEQYVRDMFATGLFNRKLICSRYLNRSDAWLCLKLKNERKFTALELDMLIEAFADISKQLRFYGK